MFAFLSTGTELRRFAKGILPRLAVAVMLFIPLLYGVLYLWAFWDPVGNMNHLPVALVNQDTGTTVSGKHTNYGNTVAKKLYDRQDMKWEKTSAAEAAKGVKNGTYYFSVTIPKNFSKQAVSPSTNSPKTPELVVKYNDSNSFLASTLGKQAMAQVRTVVAQQFGQKYAKTALVGLQSARSGLSQASTGSGKITKGLKSAKSGTKELNVGLGTLVSGMTELSSGSKTLSTSTQELASGAATLDSGAKSLASGASSANSGAQQLASGSITVDSGAKQLSSGASGAASGIRELQSGATSLKSGNADLYSGLKTLQSGITTVQSGHAYSLSGGSMELQKEVSGQLSSVKELSTAMGEVQSGVQQVLNLNLSSDQATNNQLKLVLLNAIYSQEKYPSLSPIASTTCDQITEASPQLYEVCQLHQAVLAITSNGGTGSTSLYGTMNTIASSVTELNEGINGTDGVINGVSKLTNGAKTASEGASKLSDGLDTLASESQKLVSGASSLASGTGSLASGAKSLATGTSQLSSGASTLASGTSSLSTGASKLATGASTLNSGVTSATSGAKSAKSGAQQLADGSGKLLKGSQTLTARLTSGTKQIPKSSKSTVKKQAKVVAQSTVLKQSWLHNAKVFGVGFAPFFMSLAMFVGGIITWLLLRALPTRALAAGVNGWRAAMSGFLPAALFGIGQVVIMLGVIIFGLGLNPAYPVTTVLFTLLSCFAFLAMQQMFIITMGPAAGRVVALALLMFQLSSSGGTYPVETTPEFFRVITHIMPITYVVNGLRESITGGIDGRFWIALAVLLFVLFGSLIISAIAAARQRQWTIARLHPELVI